MAQANPNIAADSSRRRFLTVAAAASAVSAGSLAMAAMPAPAPDDSTLVRLEKQILQHKKAIDLMEPEVGRLEDIWSKEDFRLHDKFEATRIGPTFSERKAIVEAMPEFRECMRLRHLQASEREVAEGLVKQMWKIPAQTAEGRRAKVSVLLSFVLDDDEWRTAKQQPGDVYDVIQARDLLIELVGGAPGEQLRGQFA
jgi:hypothetical protein